MMTLPLLFLASALAASPGRSHNKIVSANGRGVLVFNGEDPANSVIDTFTDRVYQQETPAAEPVRDLLYDAYFALDGEWLTANLGFGYHFPGSGVMSIVRRDDAALRVSEWVWTPMDLGHPGYIQMLKIENLAEADKTVTVNSLHNVHLGDDVEGVMNGNEAIWSNGSDLVEVGTTTGLGMWFHTTTPTSSYTCDGAFANPSSYDGRCGTEEEPWLNNDQVGGFEWTVTIPGESTAWVDVMGLFFSGGDPSGVAAKREAWTDGVATENWVNKEGGYWNTFHVTVPRPASVSDNEYAVFKQSLTFLKMAQVTEEGDAYGQIPASFPVTAPHEDFTHAWNITWVRDQAYAAAALARAGKWEEAEAAIRFTLQGKAGGYVDEVGSEYGLSVCRMYGDGTEWSDDDGTGPNIELDNFGLTLWALAETIAAGADPAVTDMIDVWADVADPLVNAVDENGLIQADSSIWERHWNGNQKQFTYTSAMAAAGLRDIHSHHVSTAEQDRYLSASEEIIDGICDVLVDPDLGLLGNADEDPSQAADLAAVEAFNMGLLSAQTEAADATIANWEATLMAPHGNGFKRNDDGDLYDDAEWLVMDLRMAELYRRNCQVDKASAIEDWVTQQAYLNNFQIPELMDPETGVYAGPTPMLGFGAGAYVLEILNRKAAALDCADGAEETCADRVGDGDGDGTAPDDGGDADADGGGDGGDDTGSPDKSEDGCGCAASPQTGSWLLPLLIAIPLIGRRRISTP